MKTVFHFHIEIPQDAGVSLTWRGGNPKPSQRPGYIWLTTRGGQALLEVPRECVHPLTPDELAQISNSFPFVPRRRRRRRDREIAAGLPPNATRLQRMQWQAQHGHGPSGYTRRVIEIATTQGVSLRTAYRRAARERELAGPPPPFDSSEAAREINALWSGAEP